MAQADLKTKGLSGSEALASVIYQVLDADGKPVKGAFINLNSYSYYDCNRLSNGDARITTSDNGYFSLPVGDKPLGIQIMGRVFRHGVKLNPGHDTSTTIQLPRIPVEFATHVLSVELADENDQKITGPNIELYKEGKNIQPFLHQSVFDWTGIPTGKLLLKIDGWRKYGAADFSFSLLENTNYKIKIKLCSVYKASCKTSINISVVRPFLDVGTIKGVVLDSDGRGMAGAIIRAKSIGTKAAQTNADGDFEIPFLTPACYELGIKSETNFMENFHVLLIQGDVLVLKIHFKPYTVPTIAPASSTP